MLDKETLMKFDRNKFWENVESFKSETISLFEEKYKDGLTLETYDEFEKEVGKLAKANSVPIELMYMDGELIGDDDTKIEPNEDGDLSWWIEFFTLEDPIVSYYWNVND